MMHRFNSVFSLILLFLAILLANCVSQGEARKNLENEFYEIYEPNNIKFTYETLFEVLNKIDTTIDLEYISSYNEKRGVKGSESEAFDILMRLFKIGQEEPYLRNDIIKIFIGLNEINNAEYNFYFFYYVNNMVLTLFSDLLENSDIELWNLFIESIPDINTMYLSGYYKVIVLGVNEYDFIKIQNTYINIDTSNYCHLLKKDALLEAIFLSNNYSEICNRLEMFYQRIAMHSPGR